MEKNGQKDYYKINIKSKDDLNLGFLLMLID